MPWLIVIPVAVLAAFFIPLRKAPPREHPRRRRFDEREIQFARARLRKGTPEYAEFYRNHPELESIDERTRNLPGLLSPESLFNHPLDTAATVASFNLVDRLRHAVDGDPAERTDLPSEEVLVYLTGWLKRGGADAVGCGPVPESCWYTNVGRGTGGYGEPIEPEHPSAIVIGMEMKREPTEAAPGSPEVAEAAARYAGCAALAVQAAGILRNLGFRARAHIDGNYRVIASEAADHTGLGSFGWSGLLLHHKYGPRMRYAVVTTDLPVKEAGRTASFMRFCAICRRCAKSCPARAISPEYPGEVDGDRCFAWWNIAGTDCGVCMAACPMGRPWGLLKRAAKRSLMAGELLLFLDALFYPGTRKPREGRGKCTK